ncbi:type I-F CRISPR-associated protein Csy1 [Ottowia oryzae]
MQQRFAHATSRWINRADSVARKAIADAREKYMLDSILGKGINAAPGVAVATHLAKGTHPDPRVKDVVNPCVSFDALSQHAEVGSHNLAGQASREDVTGNGAVNSAGYELYLLLECVFDGKKLSDWISDKDEDAYLAFGGEDQAYSCLELLSNKSRTVATNEKLKQLYWFVGDQQGASDATVDAQYHLLAPLYATSLAHAVYGVLQEDRFGEANKAARQARRDGKLHDGPLRDYPQLAVQKMGGTKPQNISQLNSERGGNNYLLASLPPQWKSRDIRQPWGVQSVFDRMLIRREGVRATLADFLAFLKTDPPANVETRNRVDAYVSDLIDALVTLGGELQRAWPAHWTQDPRCELVREEQLWLDARRAEVDEDFGAEWQRMDWPAQIGKRFGNWLNTQLEKQFAVGDAEQREWANELLVDESEDGWAQNLHKQRTALNAPHQIPTRLGDQGAVA